MPKPMSKSKIKARRKVRMGRNPKTGEPIKIKARSSRADRAFRTLAKVYSRL